MSLARLLAAGKCLVGARDDESPYRVTHEGYLPKFSPETSQVSVKPRSESPPGGLWAREEVDASGVGKTDAEAKVSAGTENAKERETPKRLGAAVKESRNGMGWWSRLAGLFGRRKSRGPARLPLMTRRQVQCELSLDDVKVIRNDLKDSDVEIVRLRSSAAPSDVVPLSLRRGRSGASATFLGRAGGRLFGSR
jgi:hypothetical protein